MHHVSGVLQPFGDVERRLRIIFDDERLRDGSIPASRSHEDDSSRD
jgi:hypothetical protein